MDWERGRRSVSERVRRRDHRSVAGGGGDAPPHMRWTEGGGGGAVVGFGGGGVVGERVINDGLDENEKRAASARVNLNNA